MERIYYSRPKLVIAAIPPLLIGSLFTYFYFSDKDGFLPFCSSQSAFSTWSG